LPSVGDQVEAGQSCGEVESTKSVSELYAPVTGQVTEVNSVVDDAPETINSAPYEAGWLFRIDLGDPSQLDGLLSASEYEAMTQGA
jgi:glycine cleavage system H protein